MLLPNPLRGPNPFRLGLFAANCSGGMMLSKAPERWRASWDDVAASALMAEEAGWDFILPIARWKGFPGEGDSFGTTFETLTHGAALAGLTRRIAICVTIHVTLVHPVFAAKALATIDHASHGRLGVNIVCGWNQAEFGMFGKEPAGSEARYEQGLEWYDIVQRMFAGEGPFDVEGKHYQGRGLESRPGSLQRPRPVTISAGYSPPGRDFAARVADVLFTSIPEMERTHDLVGDVAQHAARYDRKIEVFTSFHVVCRETRKQAEDYYHYCAEEMADHEAAAFYRQQRKDAVARSVQKVERPSATRFNRGGKAYAGSYPGVYPMVGTPDDVVEEIVEMHRLGVAGAAISFANYLDEMPYFNAEVLPRLAKAGLRAV
jgi:alkanesulfonate monooxygenase SsuD/methylene tetrahydromethanopterin reductase-like flavin-dependent oxidoreductase (luciferase family)